MTLKVTWAEFDTDAGGGGAYASDAAAGAITLTGSPATDVRTLLSSATPGQIALTGSNATSGITRVSSAAAGQITLTGSTATSVTHKLSSAAAGQINLTGYAATSDHHTAGATLSNADPGAYDILASIATGTRSLLSNAATGSLVITGSTATSFRSITSSASTGSIALTGTDTAALRTFVSTTDSGQIIITGYAATSTSVLPTVARPAQDISDGAWLPSVALADLYSMLDEVSPDDADYIYTNSTAATCEVKLNAIAPPGTSAGQVVSYQVWSPTSNGLTVKLMCGITEVASWTHAPLPTTSTRYDQNLTAGQIALITDYADLRLQMTSS